MTNVAVAAISGGSWSTWSFIRAMSGERTRVGSGRSIAASWYVSDLPEPVGIRVERVAPRHGGADDLLLSGAKRVESEEFPQRRLQVGHANECTGRIGTTSCRLRLCETRRPQTGSDAIAGAWVGALTPPSGPTVTATTAPAGTVWGVGTMARSPVGAKTPAETGVSPVITHA